MGSIDGQEDHLGSFPTGRAVHLRRTQSTSPASVVSPASPVATTHPTVRQTDGDSLRYHASCPFASAVVLPLQMMATLTDGVIIPYAAGLRLVD
jgi:hypothetical protein